MRIKSLGEVGITVRVSLVCPDGYRRGVIVEMELPYGCSRPRYESIGTGRIGTHAVLSHLDIGLVSCMNPTMCGRTYGGMWTAMRNTTSHNQHCHRRTHHRATRGGGVAGRLGIVVHGNRCNVGCAPHENE